METGVYIRVANKNVDIGNRRIGIDKLVEWYMGLGVEGQIRLMMVLLDRREEYDEWKHNESLKQKIGE
jgi:hypothetical protein